jgi:hypothetical protein
MRPLTARLAGHRHHPGAITPLSRLELVLEAANEHDREAVAVHANGLCAGYLEAGLASVVRRLIVRGRPVLVAPSRTEGQVTLFLPERTDRYGETLLPVTSSDGLRRYWVDQRRDLCTCPAGRWKSCRHRRAVRVLATGTA